MTPTTADEFSDVEPFLYADASPPSTPGGSRPSSRPSSSPAIRRLSADAWRHAQTGWVCMGPAGTPVCGNDVKFFEMVEQEKPAEVGAWFSAAANAGFFNCKMNMPEDAEEREYYVVYRSAGQGPGVYDKWDDVASAVLGVHGTMYQRCYGWLDVTCRLIQALSIEGLVVRLPESVRRAGTMAVWLEALAPSPYPPLRMCPGLLRPPSAAIAALPATVGELLRGPGVAADWRTFEPYRKPAFSYPDASSSPAPIIPLAPQPIRGARGTTRSTRSPTVSHLSHAASLSAVGGGRLAGRGGAPGIHRTPTPTPTPATDAANGQFHVVYNGVAPWIYHSAHAAEIIVEGCKFAHVVSFDSFQEALNSFRYAVRAGHLVVEVVQ